VGRDGPTRWRRFIQGSGKLILKSAPPALTACRRIFRNGAISATGLPRNIGASIAASACRMIGGRVLDRGCRLVRASRRHRILAFLQQANQCCRQEVRSRRLINALQPQPTSWRFSWLSPVEARSVCALGGRWTCIQDTEGSVFRSSSQPAQRRSAGVLNCTRCKAESRTFSLQITLSEYQITQSYNCLQKNVIRILQIHRLFGIMEELAVAPPPPTAAQPALIKASET
jgi:hypothetical protein